MEICNFCNCKFTGNAMNRHLSECKQIHSPTSLTDSQRDVFIRKLLMQVNNMSGKMKDMQTEINYLKKKQKNQIATLLNKQTEIPSMHILDWIKSIPVSQLHLELVFRKSIEDGIQQVIVDAITTGKTIGSNIPVRAYTEKQKCLFVYLQKGDHSKWVTCDNTVFRSLCVCIASRFIELFLLWQTTQSETDFQTQEQNMHFMKKVMETTYTQQGHISKMIEHVYINIHTEMNIQEYD